MLLEPHGRPTRTTVLRRAGRHCVVAVSVLVIVAGSAACSGDDATERPTRTTAAPASWTSELDDECSALDEQFDHLAAADPSTPDDAISYAEDVDAFAEELVAILDGVVDDDGRSEVEPLRAAATELEAATSRLAQGAISQDTAEVDAATDEVNRLIPTLNEIAAELELSSCGGF